MYQKWRSEAALARLAAAVGEAAPTAITFRPGEVPAPPAPAAGAAVAERPAIAPATRLLAEELTCAMTDQDLRATIARAAAASLARDASDRGF